MSLSASQKTGDLGTGLGIKFTTPTEAIPVKRVSGDFTETFFQEITSQECAPLSS